MKVLLLTVEQKDLIAGGQFNPDSYFNPVQDANDNWIISLQERDFNTNPDFDWIADLPEIDYEPKIIEED